MIDDSGSTDDTRETVKGMMNGQGDFVQAEPMKELN
jgi:hypothetical protein